MFRHKLAPKQHLLLIPDEKKIFRNIYLHVFVYLNNRANFFSEFFQNPCITHYDTLFTVKHGFMLIPHTASLIIIIRKI